MEWLGEEGEVELESLLCILLLAIMMMITDRYFTFPAFSVNKYHRLTTRTE